MPAFPTVNAPPFQVKNEGYSTYKLAVIASILDQRRNIIQLVGNFSQPILQPFDLVKVRNSMPVSYTHLTLPTILRV